MLDQPPSGIIRGAIAVLAIVAVVVVVLLYAGRYYGAGPAASTTTVSQNPYSGYVSEPIAFVAAPQVPVGVGILYMSYTDLALQFSYNGNLTWATGTLGAPINLMSLANASQVVSSVYVPANSIVTAARFNVTQMYIQLGSGRYPLALPNSTVVVPVASATTAKAGSAVFVNMVPSVGAVYSHGVPTYIIAPSTKAALVNNPGANITVGGHVPIGLATQYALSFAAPNITITRASLSAAANFTLVNITVSDNSNSSVLLNNIFISGPVQVAPAGAASYTSSPGSSSNQTVASLGPAIVSAGNMEFVASSGGSIVVPTSAADIQFSGYLVSGRSRTSLGYYAPILYNSGTLQVAPVRGSKYLVTVTGQGGSVASALVTAT